MADTIMGVLGSGHAAEVLLGHGITCLWVGVEQRGRQAVVQRSPDLSDGQPRACSPVQCTTSLQLLHAEREWHPSAQAGGCRAAGGRPSGCFEGGRRPAGRWVQACQCRPVTPLSCMTQLRIPTKPAKAFQ